MPSPLLGRVQSSNWENDVKKKTPYNAIFKRLISEQTRHMWFIHRNRHVYTQDRAHDYRSLDYLLGFSAGNSSIKPVPLPSIPSPMLGLVLWFEEVNVWFDFCLGWGKQTRKYFWVTENACPASIPEIHAHPCSLPHCSPQKDMGWRGGGVLA